MRWLRERARRLRNAVRRPVATLQPGEEIAFVLPDGSRAAVMVVRAVHFDSDSIAAELQDRTSLERAHRIVW